MGIRHEWTLSLTRHPDGHQTPKDTQRHPSSGKCKRKPQWDVTWHLTAARMAKINNTRNNRCWWGYGEGGAPLHSCWACENVQPLWKTVWRVLKNLKIGDPWVVQWFGACLWPWARSWRPEMESHVGLPVHGACFSLCLCLCLSLSLCDYHK